MNTLKGSLWAVLVAGFGFLTIMLLTRSPRPLAPDASAVVNGHEPIQEIEQTEPVLDPPASLAAVAVRHLASVIQLTPDKTEVHLADLASEPSNLLRVRADQVLATVNDQAILLKDLVPLRPDEQEQAMTVDEYESRLNRAIEMELTFQAAAAQGVDLTPEQKQRVDGVVQKHHSTFQEYQKQGITWSSVTTVQIEFERRLTSALMLQQNLVAREAGVAPASDPALQACYEQARNEVLSRLRSSVNISFSTTEL